MPRTFVVLALVGAFSIVAEGAQAQESEAGEQDAVPEPAPLDPDEILDNPLSESDYGAATLEPAPVDLDEILDNPLSESDYREQETCLRIRSIDDIEVLDETLVLFYGRRGELWLNQLISQCYGLEEDMILQFRPYAGTYCRLDAFRGMPRFSTIAITAECRLGHFELVDEIQVEALRIAVAERQEVSDMAKETRRRQRRQRSAD